MDTETVYHIICCCQALAPQHYNFFVEPKDIKIRPLTVYLCKRDRVDELLLKLKYTIAKYANCCGASDDFADGTF
jgi:hypothetical protein